MLRFIASICLVWLYCVADVASAGVVIVANNPPLDTDIPNIKTRIQAIDFETREVAFSKVVSGQVQSATLSDQGDAVFSVGHVGTSLFAPRSSLYVQKIGDDPLPALLTYDGPIRNLGVTSTRLVWNDDEGIRVRSRTNGSSQLFGNANASLPVISGNRLLWYNSNVLNPNQNRVAAVNLSSGSYTGTLFQGRSIHSLGLPQHAPESTGSLVIVPSAMAISGGQVFSDSEFHGNSSGELLNFVNDSGQPISVSSLKQNASHLTFKDYQSLLYLRNGSQVRRLSGHPGRTAGEFAIGPDDVSWIETTGAGERLFLHDIAGGRTRSLAVDSSDFNLWDMNDRYVLVTSTVAGPEIGDFNGDSSIDALDYVVWRQNSDVNGSDPNGHLAWRENYGRETGNGSGAAVPEPTALILLLAGLISLSRFHRHARDNRLIAFDSRPSAQPQPLATIRRSGLCFIGSRIPGHKPALAMQNR